MTATLTARQTLLPAPENTSGNAADGPARDLLAALAAGCPRAWADVVTRYRGLVRARIAPFRLQPCDAADAEQATWMRLAEHAHRIRTPDALPGWLGVVARRECLAILRRSAAGPVLAQDAAAERPDPGAGVEQQVLDRVDARALWLAVDRLPTRQRRLVQALFGPAPLPYEEIVRRMQMPTGSIGPTRARALDRLRRALADDLSVDLSANDGAPRGTGPAGVRRCA